VTTQLIADFGFTAGRIKPAHWSPVDGDYCFVLGSDEPGVTATLAPDEGVVISQACQWGMTATPPVGFVRARVHVRCPSVPGNYAWVFSCSDDDQVTFQTRLKPGEEYDLAPIVPAVGSFSGVAITYGLKLVYLGGITPAPLDIEIPAVYIDAVDTVEDVSQFLLFCTPENGETQVPLSGATLRVAYANLDPLGAAFDINLTSVLINGAPVFDPGTGLFIAPFDGPGSAVTDLGAVVIFDIDFTGSFDSLSTVTFDVTTGPDALTMHHGSSSFTTYDATPPILVSARSLSMTQIRVEFDEPVRMLGDGTGSDSLDPLSWSVRAKEAPYFVPEITSVTADGGSAVILNFAQELSPGILYTVDASNVADTHGNAPPSSTIDVRAALAYDTDRDFDLWSLIPEKNRDEDNGDLRRFIACLQQIVDLLLASIDRWIEIVDIEKAPEAFLDLILETLGNPFAFVLSVAEKRRLARTLNRIFAEKGTDPGIENAIAFFMGVVATVELPAATGFELGTALLGEDTELGLSSVFLAYSFRVRVDGVLSDTQRDQLEQIVRYMKPSRTHFLGIVEPVGPGEAVDNWALGFAQLGIDTVLH